MTTTKTDNRQILIKKATSVYSSCELNRGRVLLLVLAYHLHQFLLSLQPILPDRPCHFLTNKENFKLKSSFKTSELCKRPGCHESWMSILFIPPSLTSASDSSCMALDTFPPKISDRFYMNWVLFNDNKNYVQEGLKVGSLKGYMYSVFYLILNAVNQLLERGVTLHSKNLQSPLQRMLCAKFDWNSPWIRARSFIWTNLNPALRQVRLKLDQWFWRRFLNVLIIIWLFRYYLPLEKGLTLHLNKRWTADKVHLSLWLRWAKKG